MTAAKRKPPTPWTDTSQPHNDKPRTQQCPRCRAPVLRALVGHVAAVDVRVDPYPLGPAQELAARLEGRLAYCLRLHRLLPPRLIHRGTEHIRAGRCTHLVLADHRCPARTQPHTAPQPPAPDRLF